MKTISYFLTAAAICISSLSARAEVICSESHPIVGTRPAFDLPQIRNSSQTLYPCILHDFRLLASVGDAVINQAIACAVMVEL